MIWQGNDDYVSVCILPVNLLFVYLYVWLSVPPRPNPAKKETGIMKGNESTETIMPPQHGG